MNWRGMGAHLTGKWAGGAVTPDRGQAVSPGLCRRSGTLTLHLLAAVLRQFDYLAALAGSLMRLAAEIQ